MVMMDIFRCLGVDHMGVDMSVDMGMGRVMVVEFRWWGGGRRGCSWSEE